MILSALGLAGEVGEYVDHVKKHRYHAHPWDQDEAIKELGDVAWYLMRACEAIGVQMGDVLQENLLKLQRRYPNGFSPEASINRSED